MGIQDHNKFLSSEFWKDCPLYSSVKKEEFLNYTFQIQNSITEKSLFSSLGKVADSNFIEDVRKGILQSPMAIRISPYIFSLIDWKNPYEDPIRKQFLPVNSAFQPNHPQCFFDSLNEQKHSPVKSIIHRYPNRALFLPLDVCPVYCRFCTRSYAVGADTEINKKKNFIMHPKHWEASFSYLKKNREIEDVIVSGGDVSFLSSRFISLIGERLLEIEHIRSIRFATKVLCVIPMKFLSDKFWVSAIREIANKGRKQGKEVSIQTHFNSSREITQITKEAMEVLFQAGLKVRNQTVCIRGVNDSAEEMKLLIKKLSLLNIQPYYVYQHDMVKNVEELRTSVRTTQKLEKAIRGTVTGFHMPHFVLDAPQGGGKRQIHSPEYYNEELGISVWKSPYEKKETLYFYFDPLQDLDPIVQKQWMDSKERRKILKREGILN